MAVRNERTPPVRTPDPLSRSRSRALRRLGRLRAMGLGAIGDIGSVGFITTEKVTWETASDWDSAVSETVGAVHENRGYAPLNDASTITLGWPVDDPNGTNVQIAIDSVESSGPIEDFSGNNYDFSPTGVSLQAATGPWGRSVLKGDGTDDYLDGGGAGSVYNGGGISGFTILIWVNFDAISSSSPGHGGAGTGDDEFHAFRWDNDDVIHMSAGNSDELYCYIDDGGNREATSTSSPFSNSTWHLAIMRYDGGANTCYGYVDGNNEVLSFSSGSPKTGSSPENYLVGYPGQDHADMAFGPYRFYDRTFSTSELQEWYDAGTSGSLTTATKSFSGSSQPDLVDLTYSLNDGAIDIDVIGSPGEGGEETVNSGTLDGVQTGASLTWSSSHTNFRVKPNLSTTNIDDSAPTIGRIALQV